MNFKLERFCYLTISYILGAFFFVVGICGILFPWIFSLQQAFIHFLTEHTLVLSLFSLSFVVIGLSIILYALANTRRRYVHITTGAYSTTLDEAIIHRYLENYWHKLFPQTYIPFQVLLKKEVIQVSVDFPALPLDEQKSFLEKIRKDFSEIFEDTLGYSHEVHLIASFQNNAKETSKISKN